MASLHFARNQANDVSSLTWGTIRSSGVGCVAAAVVVQQPRMCDCKRSFGRAQRGSGEVVAGASHVPGVAEVLAALSGALVGAHLKVDDALASAQLLLRPFALLFLGGLGSQAGSVVLGVSVAGTADGHQALGDLGNVPLLPQVDGLPGAACPLPRAVMGSLGLAGWPPLGLGGVPGKIPHSSGDPPGREGPAVVSRGAAS